MGFFDFLKKKNDSKNYSQLKGTDWYAPIYSQFGDNIYASDVVLSAIACIVREMKKLSPQHVIESGNGKSVPVNDDIQRALDNPNPLMTTTDFIEKITWQLFANYNSFVFPTYQNDILTGLYPLQPTQVEFIQDMSDKIYVKLSFANGYNPTIPYDSIIHLRYNFSTSEFLGGGKNGQPNHSALLKTLELNDSLLKGVEKALKSSYTINGIVKYNTMLNEDKTSVALEELTRKLNNNESGFLPLDIKGEFIPFNKQLQLVDSTTLKFIDEKILRTFGVSLPILTGDYTKAQYEAFFQKVCEPLIVTFNQAFTKTLFSKHEISGFGHKIIFTHKLLDFMSMGEKIQWLTLASSIGAITINEARAIVGYPMCDDENANKLIMSKNFGTVASVANMDKEKEAMANE